MGQGQFRVIIYINYVEVEYISCSMPSFMIIGLLVLQEKIFEGFTINEHGGHLGHVTCAIYINFLSHFPRRLHTKFGFDWPSCFREDV